MVNNVRPLNVDSEPRGCTFQNAARRWDISVHTLKRAEGHGLIKTIRMGDRSIIPPAEVARIDREGLGPIPAGYKRKTTGHLPGRQRSSTTTKDAAGKPPPRRTKRGEERITT